MDNERLSQNIEDLIREIREDRRDRKREKVEGTELKELSDSIQNFGKSVASYLEKMELREQEKRLASKKTKKTDFGGLFDFLNEGKNKAKDQNILGALGVLPFIISFAAIMDEGNKKLKELDQKIQGGLVLLTSSINSVFALTKTIGVGMNTFGKTISAFFSALLKPFQGLSAIIQKGIASVSKLVGTVTKMVSSIFKVIAGFPLKQIGIVLKTVGRVSGFLTAAILVFDGVMNAIKTTWDKDKNFLQNIFSADFMFAFFNGVWKSIVDTVRGMFSLITDIIPSVFSKLTNFAADQLSAIGVDFSFLDGLGKRVEEFSQGWKDFTANKLIPFLVKTLSPGVLLDPLFKVFEIITEKFSALKTAVTNFNPFSKEGPRLEAKEKREETSERIKARADYEKERAVRIARSEEVSRAMSLSELYIAIRTLNNFLQKKNSAPVVVSAPVANTNSVNVQNDTFLSTSMSSRNQFDPALAL